MTKSSLLHHYNVGTINLHRLFSRLHFSVRYCTMGWNVFWVFSISYCVFNKHFFNVCTTKESMKIWIKKYSKNTGREIKIATSELICTNFDELRIKNDLGHNVTIVYSQRIMQMFGFIEVLLSRHIGIQFTFTLHLYHTTIF